MRDHITLQVARYRPEKESETTFDEYEVPCPKDWVVLDGLNHIVDLIIPVYGQEGGTLVVPGHGRLSDMGDVVNYREMTTIIRDRIQDMIKKGMTLEQVKAAKPTRDYDPRYGATTGFWTTDMFIEAVYKSLSPKK